MRAVHLLALAAAATSPGCYLILPMVPIAMVGSGAELAEDTPIGTPATVHGGLALGRSDLDSSWTPADQLPWLGLDGDRRINQAPVWVASWFGVGYSDDVPLASPRGQGATTSVDFGIGLRHYQAFGPLEPFVGTGLGFVDRRFTYTDAEPGNLYDYSVGGYLEAGLSCALVTNFAIAVSARRYVGTDQSLADQDFAADTTTFVLVLSFRR